jgi:hypothetical protein
MEPKGRSGAWVEDRQQLFLLLSVEQLTRPCVHVIWLSHEGIGVGNLDCKTKIPDYPPRWGAQSHSTKPVPMLPAVLARAFTQHTGDFL